MSTVTLRGVTLHYDYQTQANPRGTIVFLNGVMASLSSWKLYAEYFYKRGYNILLHDFRGQLLSDKPEGPYSFETHAMDTFALLKTLKIDKAHLIGTSYGGEVAMKMAAMDASVIASISVINSVSELDDSLIDKVKRWKTLAASYDAETFMRGMSKDIYSDDFLAANQAMIDKRIEAMQALDSSYFDGQITLYDTFLEDVTMTDELKNINVPTLVVSGENDTLKPPKFSRLITSAIEDAVHVMLPGSGHVSIFEKPSELKLILVGFLES